MQFGNVNISYNLPRFTFAYAFVLLIYLLFLHTSSYSQEIEPRNYANVPVKMNLAALTYSLSQGSVVADASSPIQDLDLTSHSIVATYLRTFSLFGKLGKIQINMPYIFLSGTAKLRGMDTSATRSGFADTRFKIGVNLIGSPALLPKDFQKYSQEFIFGVSLVVAIPTGQYYPERLINIGTNRWAVKPELGISKRFGALYFEFYSGVWFLSENNEYLKTNTLSQDPVFSFQGHISYLFPSQIWLAFNAGFANGGETKLNGVARNDLQKNSRIGSTLSIPLSIQSSIKLMAHTGVYVRTGQNASVVSLTYQYLWF